ncbi:hypothetical protein HanHA300_Chr00c1075g0837831 [Helianthus annuus]|nr:hypothetical protein HanHA300_Chr00c1075g0837831 [Helianthus annuus]KAJ0803448.1 hypothetical protein HanLR1_Chr00c1846g0822291 [Helianthus annuus]
MHLYGGCFRKPPGKWHQPYAKRHGRQPNAQSDSQNTPGDAKADSYKGHKLFTYSMTPTHFDSHDNCDPKVIIRSA